METACLNEYTGNTRSNMLDSYKIDIMVGTTAGISQGIGSGAISTTDLEHIVVDEVDQWMDYRSVDDNMIFLRELVDEEEGRSKCQIVLVGAFLGQACFRTLSDAIPGLEQYVNRRSHQPLGHVKQRFMFVNNINKAAHFAAWLKEHVETQNMTVHKPLIFCNFANTATWLHNYLIDNGINNILFSKRMTARSKTELLQNEIPNTDYPIVAVDGFGVGLDFREIGLVVNYEFPHTYEDYLRRIGRTGRMSSNAQACQAVSYVSYNKDKALYGIIKNSFDDKECRAYSLSPPNKNGWFRNVK